jgi:hypothetical protein
MEKTTVTVGEEENIFDDMQEAIDFIIDDLMLNDIAFSVRYE